MVMATVGRALCTISVEGRCNVYTVQQSASAMSFVTMSIGLSPYLSNWIGTSNSRVSLVCGFWP